MEKWHAAKPGSVEKGGRLAGGKGPAGQRDARRRRRSTRRCSARRWSRRRARDPRVIGITAAMAGGTGLSQLAARAARPVLRRRHRRAARGAVRGRPGARGHEAGVRDLLDLPPARVRPDHPRRLPAEAGRRVRDGPRGPGRRRRADAPRLLRHLVPARDPEHGRDGAARRGDAGAHAAHARSRTTGPVALRYPRGAAVGVPLPERADRDPRRHRRDPGAGRARRAGRLRHRRADRARRGRGAARARASSRPSATRASPSRSTASCCTRWPRATTCS